jgi:CheY-like chemotaxis protein
VAAHHGQLDIRSQVGQGTQVKLTFPAAGAGAPAPAPDPAAPARQLPAAPALEVLVVDDDDLFLRSTQAILALAGYAVTCAVSGEQALAHLEQGHRPGVVLLDLNMPGLGGEGTLPRLRALLPEVPVLLTTGSAEPEVLARLAALPRVTLLTKPFAMKELLEELRRAEAIRC